MKTFVFNVRLEEADGKWCAIVPELEHRGAATWGDSREEALKNIQDVVESVLEIMHERGEPLVVQ
ncbi:MAG: type II toxin-antitoxin system HicB family antitoxin [Candidatus Hydrogenedentota bacterium]